MEIVIGIATDRIHRVYVTCNQPFTGMLEREKGREEIAVKRKLRAERRYRSIATITFYSVSPYVHIYSTRGAAFLKLN